MSFAVKRDFRVLVWLVVSLLYACSLSPINEPEPARLKLLPPMEGPGALLLKQKITIDYEGQQQVFLVVSRLQPSSVQTVVLLASGQKLLSMTYNGVRLVVEGAGADEMPGQEILAMMQFSLWPEASIRQHYQDSMGWVLNLSAQQRILRHWSEPIVKVSYRGSLVEIMNYQRNYSVTVEPLGKSE
jgi:hypothetical protein